MATQPVGGAQPAQNSSDSVNGRNQTIPAVPAVNGGGNQDHARKSSMVVTPAGANYNGGAIGGPQNKANIQFGNITAGGSPAPSNAALPQISNTNLGVNQMNPSQRAASPHAPSPIPQPIEPSGGRPPSSTFGQNGFVFGQQQGDGDQSGQARGVSNMQFGSAHDRRGSSHSMHSDFSNQNLPTGPGSRGFQSPAGRGRGSYSGNYPPQMSYSPHNSFRGQSNGRGMPPYAGRGQQVPGFQGSPSIGSRNPAMMNNAPGTPQQMHLTMQPNGMQPGMQPHYYYQGQPQVLSPSFSLPPEFEPTRGNSGKTRSNTRTQSSRGRGRGGRGRGKGPHEDRFASNLDPASDNHPANVAHRLRLHHFPDLSPASGNFESLHQLTKLQQGGPMRIDPSIEQNYQMNMNFGMQGHYPPHYPNQSSPRPPYQPGYGVPMHPTNSNQGQAPSMSRASSQMSNAPERPGSSVGHQPHTPSIPTSSMPMQSGSRATSMPHQPKPNPSFTIPEKKKSAIVIKNPNTGEALNFKDKAPASPAPTPAVAPVVPPTNPTPPSRTPSAVEQSHVRTESASAKTDEERKRAMQEAVKQRIAEQAKEQAKQDSALEEKAEIHQEKSDTAKVEVEEPKATAEEPEKEAEAAPVAKDEEPEEAPVVEKPAEQADAPADTPAESKSANDDEPDFEAMLAEMEAKAAEEEAEEARLEAEYQKKKAAQKESQARREEEEAEEYERTMKQQEREAEEREAQREKERDGAAPSDDESKRLFAELKSGVKTPASTDTPAEATPNGPSGTATPVSDVSMPPPARGLGPKRGKAAELTLDTKKPVEPPEPSATLKALQSAKRLNDLSTVSYPSDIASPNPALNQNAPANRGFKYEKSFLLQFQSIFKEKPSLDWDTRIRDVMGEGDRSAQTARTPGSAMGGRQPSFRNPAASNFSGPMGTFTGARAPLPPGTTSEQRYAMSMGRGGPMPNAFPMGRGGMAMGRQPSNNMPGSPRVGGQSRGGRADSKRSKHSTKQLADENKSMPLTAGLNVGSLEVSATGWKPRSVGQAGALGPAPGGGDAHMDPETVQRKVKAALNKMTPEKFDKISDGILAIAAQSKEESDGRTLRQVIQLTFEKATDEAHWAPMYARFCLKTLQSMSVDIKDENVKDKNGQVVTGGNLFRKYLLNRCQEEFERGWKVNIPEPKGDNGEAAILSDDYYVAMAAKRRGLGLVKFIGELFKLGMLTERIMHECVKKLVDYEGTPDEAEIESLTSLLRTIGRQLDDPNSKAQGRMDVYFDRIRQIMELPDLNSRLKFMLLDIIDLRKSHWISKDDEKGPKTITQIHEEAERKQQADEAARLAQQANRGRGGPMQMGRGDARSFSYGQVPPPDNSNRVGMDDLRRLGAQRSNRNASNTTGMGPALLGPRTNSGRRGLGPNAFNRGDDSNASSRTGTPPATKKEEKKDEASTNAFSALAALENETPNSPPSHPGSPPSRQVQPSIDRSRSPDAKAE